MLNRSRQIVIDVEATGAYPEPFALLQIGAVTLDGKEFYTTVRPARDSSFNPQAMNAIGLTQKEVMDYALRGYALEAFDDWLCQIRMDTGDKRLTSWSDNPAYDWQFINRSMNTLLGANMLGYSMRRIGDLWAGHTGNPGDHTSWKKLRDTRHSHNALDDARGNAEALNKILDMIESR